MIDYEDMLKVMELMLLWESWLNKDELTEDEINLLDRFIPYFTHTFTSTTNQLEGQGMKLIKIHLLHHFRTMIQLIGCAKTLLPSFQKNNKE